MITYGFTLLVYFNFYDEFAILTGEVCTCDDIYCDENNNKVSYPCMYLLSCYLYIIDITFKVYYLNYLLIKLKGKRWVHIVKFKF